jgi:hypothetical protein
MKPESLLPNFQVPATCPYSEPDQSSQLTQLRNLESSSAPLHYTHISQDPDNFPLNLDIQYMELVMFYKFLHLQIDATHTYTRKTAQLVIYLYSECPLLWI